MRVVLSSADRSAVWVHVTLAAQVLAMAALVIFEETRGGRLAERIAAVNGDPRAPGAAEIMGEVTLFALLVLAVLGTSTAAAVAYLTWLHRLRRGAVWAWLIPGVNLIAPPFALHSAWDTAGVPERRRRLRLLLLAAWWLSWLAALTMIFVSMATHESGLTGLASGTLAVTAVAAVLCAATVREAGRAARRPVGAHPFLAPLQRVSLSSALPRRSGHPAAAARPASGHADTAAQPGGSTRLGSAPPSPTEGRSRVVGG